MSTQQQEIEFNELLNRNYPTINSVCMGFCCGNTFYFDELRQECVLALWAEFSRYGLSRFRGDSTEATWIYQISYHAVLRYLQQPVHKEVLSIHSQHETESLALTDDKDEWHLLDEVMEHLGSRERAMLGYYLNEDSYSTIAAKEGISEAGARKRMSRLLCKLKILIRK